MLADSTTPMNIIIVLPPENWSLVSPALYPPYNISCIREYLEIQTCFQHVPRNRTEFQLWMGEPINCLHKYKNLPLRCLVRWSDHIACINPQEPENHQEQGVNKNKTTLLDETSGSSCSSILSHVVANQLFRRSSNRTQRLRPSLMLPPGTSIHTFTAFEC